MKLISLSAERDRISSLFSLCQNESQNVDIKSLSIFSQFMAVKSAGFVELTVQHTLSEYGRQRGNSEISRFVLTSAERLNSLNCVKIEAFLQRFDQDWWSEVCLKVSDEHLSAIDSLKTIRDQVAHGKHNGTGLTVIKKYFDSVVFFSKEFQDIILS